MVADEDNPEAWRQVAALGDMADTIKDQKNRLLIAREALTEAWPPDKNPAAQAFVDQIDILVRNMDTQRATAEKNAAALGNIVDALRQAKDKIKPLYEQYLAKSDDMVPGWWDHAEEELDEQARKHMVDAEKTVAAHAVQITAPPPYRLAPVEVRTDAEEQAGGGSASYGAGSAGSADRGTLSATKLTVPHDPPPPLPPADGTVPANAPRPSSGVELAGVISPLPTAPVPPTVAPSLPGPIPAAPGNPLIPGMVIGAPLPGAGVTSPRGPSPSGALAPFAGGVRATVPPIGATPLGRSGATIGVSPVKPSPPTWLPGVSGQPGVIGAPGHPGRGSAVGREVRRGTTMAGIPGVLGRQGFDDDEGMTSDPDNPWAAAVGVDPVIEPPAPCRRHDPGPGVIGWHG
jgi:hypothetical protein